MRKVLSLSACTGLKRSSANQLIAGTLFPCSSSAVRLFRRTRSVLRATLSMGLTRPPRSTGILEKPSRSKDSVGTSGSLFAKSRMEDVAKRLGKKEK